MVNIHYGSDKLPAARGFFYAFSKEPVKIHRHFIATQKHGNKKATLVRWLNYMILLLKFGGPC
ncbi:hypothetical protein, partial [Cronobacter sakazakii]|uniref:hypothetical protein n=1 Tax=Cronobacter sakazakii TaxID=28141 RepID=UPI0020CAC797